MVFHSSVIMSDIVAKLMMVLLANFVDKFHYEQTTFAKRMSVWTYLSLLKKREPSVSNGSLILLECKWCGTQSCCSAARDTYHLLVLTTARAVLIVDVSLRIVDSFVVSLLDKLFLSVCRGDDNITYAVSVVTATSTVSVV